MNVKDAITTRKSIRKYKSEAIPDEVVRELLDAARLAPSARNTQAHRYFVVRDKEVIHKLQTESVFNHSFVCEAPLIIVCCVDPSQYRDAADIDDKHFTYIDSSIAASFLVLRAVELGLGTVFIGLVDREKIKDILNIPKNYLIPFVFPVGYPDEEPAVKPRKDLDEIVINI